MGSEDVPPDPRVTKCVEIPHKDNVVLRFWNDRAILQNQATGESVVNFSEGTQVKLLHFDRSGAGFLHQGREKETIWVATLFKHHVFQTLPDDGGEGRLFVYTKSDHGIALEWLEKFRSRYLIVYPGEVLTEIWQKNSDTLSILCSNSVETGQSCLFWLVKVVTNLTRKNVMKKLRNAWLPSFEARFEDDGSQKGRDTVWPASGQKVQAGDRLAHDCFASTRFIIYILLLLSKFHAECLNALKELVGKFLPDQARFRINLSRQSVLLEKGCIDLSTVTSRSCFSERTAGNKRKIPRRLRKKLPIVDVLKDIFAWKEFSWLLLDLIQGIALLIEDGVACANFPFQPEEKDILTLTATDMRDPNARQIRMQAALSKAREGRRKKAGQVQRVSVAKKTEIRMRAEAAKRFCNTKQRQKERWRYFQSCRQRYQASRLVHIAFDAGRVGGRKRVLHIGFNLLCEGLFLHRLGG